MPLSVVSEFDDLDDDFGLAKEGLAMIGQSRAYNTSQDARGAGLHTSYQNDRAQTSPRPATALFPTKEVIAVLSAIGAILSARLALFVALGCMFALGFVNPNKDSLLRMGIFGVFGVCPVVWLSSRRNI